MFHRVMSGPFLTICIWQLHIFSFGQKLTWTLTLVSCLVFDQLPSCFISVRMQLWGLNTYLYGPKDDLKHRLLWREVYSPEEEGCHFFLTLQTIIVCTHMLTC